MHNRTGLSLTCKLTARYLIPWTSLASSNLIKSQKLKNWTFPKIMHSVKKKIKAVWCCQQNTCTSNDFCFQLLNKLGVVLTLKQCKALRVQLLYFCSWSFFKLYQKHWRQYIFLWVVWHRLSFRLVSQKCRACIDGVMICRLCACCVLMISCL